MPVPFWFGVYGSVLVRGLWFHSSVIIGTRLAVKHMQVTSLSLFLIGPRLVVNRPRNPNDGIYV